MKSNITVHEGMNALMKFQLKLTDFDLLMIFLDQELMMDYPSLSIGKRSLLNGHTLHSDLY